MERPSSMVDGAFWAHQGGAGAAYAAMGYPSFMVSGALWIHHGGDGVAVEHPGIPQ
jgi:hypothetical protein